MVIRCNCDDDNVQYEDELNGKKRTIIVDHLTRFFESFKRAPGTKPLHVGLSCKECGLSVCAQDVSDLKRITMQRGG